MSDKQAFDRQLEREIDFLAGPEPRVDVREIVEGATAPRHRLSFGRRFGTLQGVATAAVFVLAVVVGLGFILATDRAVVPVPAASPSVSPVASPGAPETTPVNGTWSMPDAADCVQAEPTVAEEWILSLEVCDGLRLDTPDDPRLTGAGQIRREAWDEGSAPEIWRVSNAGGWWESQRYYDHDRFVFRGSGGYNGLTAVLTLADDGTVSGFVRVGQPREEDE